MLSLLASALIFGLARRAGASEGLGCYPEILYRGDTLTVDLPADHEGLDFTIMSVQASEEVISFVPDPGDRFKPLIAPKEFARMKQVKLLTTNALGLPFGSREGSDRLIATAPPERIFTQSGYYNVWVHPPIDIEMDDMEFAACLIEYLDYPRPKSADPDEELQFGLVKLACQPEVLYRGDALTVDLPANHEGFDFGVSSHDGVWALSFEPAPRRTPASVIASAEFATMRQVKLVTTEARGLPVRGMHRVHGSPVAIGPPERIFTRSQRYEIFLDPGPHEFDRPNIHHASCWVQYFDYPRPASAKVEQ